MIDHFGCRMEDLKAMDRSEVIRAFFEGKVSLSVWDPSTNSQKDMYYQPDKYQYNVKVDGRVVVIGKENWVILNDLLPTILFNVDGPVVEVGMGKSTETLADHAYQNNRKLYSCDILMGGMFKVFDKPLYDDHYCFIGKSEDFVKQYDGGDPAVVFIDGEHKYKTIKIEVDFFLSRLAEGGVMFLHDTFPKEEHLIEADGIKPGDIYKVRQELE